MKRMLSGIKPTGQMHLGNYIGALRNFVNYQDDYQLFVFIANLHCVTVYQQPAQLRKNLKDAIALYLACGLDPDKCTIFLQSDVFAHAQLGWLLTCQSYMGELSRMTQFKEKSQKKEDGITAGIFTYPCLMAADILLYDADIVPVGQDQRQHVRLLGQVDVKRRSPVIALKCILIRQQNSIQQQLLTHLLHMIRRPYHHILQKHDLKF